MATINDVAREAGVGAATVSRVINNSGPVSEPVRQRVMEIVRQLDFVPSYSARALATKRSNIIGVVLPDLANEFYPSLIRGIQDEARRQGYVTVIQNTDWEPAIEVQSIYVLRQLSVAGAILVTTSKVDSLVSTLLDADTTVVVLDQYVEHLRVDQVTVHHYEGARTIMDYAISRGHHQIGHITGPRGSRSIDLRLRAYLDSMGWEDIAIQDIDHYPNLPVVRTGLQSHKIAQATEYLLDKHPELTCLFAVNDSAAMEALHYLQSIGKRVPHDIAIIGFDDIPRASSVHPPLTTIRQPTYDLGITGVQFLLERLRNPDAKIKQQILKPSLVIRESC